MAKITKEDIRSEIIKCGKDPIYFIDNYVRIAHPTRGTIPFKLFDYQKQLLKDFRDSRFNIVLKARQLGITTLTAAYVAWMMVFYRDKSVLVIATKFKTAANLVKKVRRMIKLLPDWLRISDVVIDNTSGIELENGSEIKASTTSADAGRSEALSLLVVDEAAHIEDFEEKWTATKPTLSAGGSCIAISSPYGVENWFYKTYIDAENNSNDFRATKLMWDVHPERDQAWFDQEARNMSKRAISQELLCHFNASRETVMNADDMDRLGKRIHEPKYKTGVDRNFWIWEEFIYGEHYLGVSDVSRGDSSDLSVLHVIKMSTMEVVAEYQGRMPPDIFANFLYNAGKEYGNCMMVVENCAIGYAVLDKLIEMQYPTLYYSEKGTHDYIEQYQAESQNNAVPGFSTTMKTRPLIIAKLEEYIRNDILRFYSSRLYNEFRTFVWNNGKAEAMRGYHDDLIMAAAIGCWVKDVVFGASVKDLEYHKSFLSSIKKKSSVLDVGVRTMATMSNRTLQQEQRDIAKNFGWMIYSR